MVTRIMLDSMVRQADRGVNWRLVLALSPMGG